MKFAFSIPASLIVLLVFSFHCHHFVVAGDISLVDFQGLLFSEVNSEIEQYDVSNHNHEEFQGRFLEKDSVSQEAYNLWDHVIEHGWNLVEFPNLVYSSSTHRALSKSRNKTWVEDDDEVLRRSTHFPFLVCSHSSTKMTGFRRLGPLLNCTKSLNQDFVVVRNDPLKTCYHVSMKYEDAKLIRDTIDTNNEDHQFTLAPLSDLMKIQIDTLSMIYDDSWTVPNHTSSGDWERLVRVGLSVGHRKRLNADDIVMIAKDIINDIRTMGKLGNESEKRGRRLRENRRDPLHVSTVGSISDSFSLTKEAQKTNNHTPRRLAKDPPNRWKRALKEGLEDDHLCEAMFEQLTINTHYNNQGFDIVLNPMIRKTEDKHGDGIERKKICGEHEYDRCSASNTHCVASLIIAISAHPLVLSVETEGPVEANDYESQWITQTKSVGRRPLRDIGINGKNQIISVIDSGLDINHKHFGPTNSKVYNTWDYTQRKVVRYDHSGGDKIEKKGGHGTKVSGAAAGRSRDNENDTANGIAEGAKLHIFDIQKGSGGYNMPSAFTLFESMHNTIGKPARIANGSWNTRYRPYPFSCRWFDEALYGKYKGDLYVASVGNEGLSGNKRSSKERTVGNPASCKNTLAVGANQSYGNRIAPGAKGVNFLAAFSSRGPTFDGRMKPDVVAPGASVLTAYAHELGKTVEVYGSSYSSPIVAGNAALVRQYFEEGKLPCKSESCHLDPSGSLVKAVLMNSAHPIKRVQVARPELMKLQLEKVSEYDHNQGMGLIQLEKTLPIQGHNKINAIVENNMEILEGDYHDIYIRATPGKCVGTSYMREFRATLSWYDPPGTTSCVKCLLNDLDIMVNKVNAKGQVEGNTYFPNGADHKDFKNNAERVRFNMQGQRRYRIRIKADNLISEKTYYSMIASGCFKIISDPTKKVLE